MAIGESLTWGENGQAAFPSMAVKNAMGWAIPAA
jgi:hypothetical protein